MILLVWELQAVKGYADEHLNKAIYKGLKNGSMTTLNATEEIDQQKN